MNVVRRRQYYWSAKVSERALEETSGGNGKESETKIPGIC